MRFTVLAAFSSPLIGNLPLLPRRRRTFTNWRFGEWYFNRRKLSLNKRWRRVSRERSSQRRNVENGRDLGLESWPRFALWISRCSSKIKFYLWASFQCVRWKNGQSEKPRERERERVKGYRRTKKSIGDSECASHNDAGSSSQIFLTVKIVVTNLENWTWRGEVSHTDLRVFRWSSESWLTMAVSLVTFILS